MAMKSSSRAVDLNLLVFSVEIVLCLIGVASQGLHHNGVREYCTDNEFSANCSGSGSVVLMISARFGNMREGTCLKNRQYVTGCGTNVLPVIDALCSGRQSCQFRVPPNELRPFKNCSKEIALYLEAEFTCLPVTSAANCGAKSPAGEPVHLPLTLGSEGFLSNSHRTWSCRWPITAQRGLQIRLTLYDFAAESRLVPLNSLGCSVYGRVKDFIAVNSADFKICSGSQRIATDFYESKSHSIEIETFSDQNEQIKGIRFLIKYKVVGCVDPELSVYATMRRESNRALIFCNTSRVSYSLECQDNAWIGDRPECSRDSLHGSSSSLGQSWNLRSFWPNGWSSSQGVVVVIVIGVGLGVLFGVLMLTPVLLYFKRRDLDRRPTKTHQQQQQQQQHSWPGPGVVDPGMIPGSTTLGGYSGLPAQDIHRKIGLNSGDMGGNVIDAGFHGSPTPFYGGGGGGGGGGDDKKCAYGLRSVGLAPIDSVQNCFVAAHSECRWPTAKRIITQEISKENPGDYEYPN